MTEHEQLAYIAEQLANGDIVRLDTQGNTSLLDNGELSNLQEAVKVEGQDQGLIEVCYSGPTVLVLANEEGRLFDAEPNMALKSLISLEIVGPVVLMSQSTWAKLNPEDELEETEGEVEEIDLDRDVPEDFAPIGYVD